MNSLSKLLCLLGALSSMPLMALEHITTLGQQHWLLSSGKGLQVINAKLEPVTRISGRYEQAAGAKINHQRWLVVGLNKTRNQLDLFEWHNNQLKLLAQQGLGKHEAVALCLYQPASSAHVQAFIVYDGHNIQQRVIFDKSTQQTLDVKVRELPFSSGLSACAVNSVNHQLYVAEESVGVWRFDANAERHMQREPVTMRKPFGQLSDEIKSLSMLNDGSLVMSQADSGQVAVWQPDNTKLIFYPLIEDTELLAGRLIDKGLKLLAYAGDSELRHFAFKIAPVEVKQPFSFKHVKAAAQTTPVSRFGDAADDPAIWLNHKQPEQSLIIGTDKQRGLAVYNLQGKEVQFLPTGRMNNVDLRQNFVFNGSDMTLVAASNRDQNSISLYMLDPASKTLTHNTEIATNLPEVYGLCMYQSPQATYVWINDKDGRYQQYLISASGTTLSGKKVREFKLPDQPEGCVADDVSGDFFVGVEDAGIWHTTAKPDTGAKLTKIISVGGNLKDDVEGLALYKRGKHHYLVVSSQGNDSYALYQATPPYAYIDSFQITADVSNGVDGASETDGLEVVSAAMGKRYPMGLLVVQDGRNVMPSQPQNYKLVSFAEILDRLRL